MILINNLKLSLDTDFSNLSPVIASALKISQNRISKASLYKKSVDARHKDNVHFCCSVLAEILGDEQKLIKRFKNTQLYTPKKYTWEKAELGERERPVIVGFGPAGIFAALTLAKAGLKPIVIERGKSVDERNCDVDNFFKTGKLNPESNVQFGEGGAGTFSDGKLNTGIKNPRIRTVLEEFVRAGAPENILTDAKPHIGTDILKTVVKNLREQIISLGGQIRFSSKLEDISFNETGINHITVNGENIPCSNLILATGHSARDIFSMLKAKNIEMMRKPFAMGVRIEHLRRDIDTSLYGAFADHPALGAADYKLVTHLESGRDVYTFCMCPGGEVINSSSEPHRIAVNGMSKNARNGENSNSALLVGINPEDIEGDDILGGCALQEKIEKSAFKIASGKVPITTIGSFVFGEDFKIGKVKPSVKPDTANADFDDIFPKFITESLKKGIVEFDKKIHGFADKDAILTAPETRSSSPIRILRDEKGVSPSLFGLYPCGEGAGYAGGIMSAAVDGMKIAESVIESYKK